MFGSFNEEDACAEYGQDWHDQEDVDEERLACTGQVEVWNSKQCPGQDPNNTKYHGHDYPPYWICFRTKENSICYFVCQRTSIRTG